MYNFISTHTYVATFRKQVSDWFRRVSFPELTCHFRTAFLLYQYNRLSDWLWKPELTYSYVRVGKLFLTLPSALNTQQQWKIKFSWRLNPCYRLALPQKQNLESYKYYIVWSLKLFVLTLTHRVGGGKTISYDDHKQWVWRSKSKVTSVTDQRFYWNIYLKVSPCTQGPIKIGPVQGINGNVEQRFTWTGDVIFWKIFCPGARKFSRRPCLYSNRFLLKNLPFSKIHCCMRRNI